MSKEKPFDFRSAADTCLGIERVIPTKEEREKFQVYRWNGREYVPMRKG